MAEEKVIKVFISSTFEDFGEERVAVKKAIEEARLTMASHKIVLLPIDLRSSARPNPPLEECLREVASSQVLIGLIGMRYGSVDGETGKSISELEYDKAISCNIPPLMYISKKINRDYIDTDPTLLAKLEAFRQKVEQNHKRDTFDSCDILRGHILRDLPPCVIEKYAAPFIQPEGEAVESPEKPATERADKVVQTEGGLSASAKEIKQLLKFISDNINDIKNMDSQKRRRLFLLASTLFYDTELSGALETHELQILYLSRKDILPFGREVMFLGKSAFADTYGNKAGWFWMRKFGSEMTLGILRWLCLNEGDEDIRTGCFQLLKHFWSDETETIITNNVSSDKKKVRLEALKILEELASEKCLDILEKAAADQDIDIQRGARRAQLAILTRYNPSKAVSFIEKFENEYATGDASALSDIMPKLKIDGLRKLKEHKNEEIKQLAVVELAERGELNDNELNVLINDSNEDVKYWGYRSLIGRGKKFNIEEVKKNWPITTPRYPSILTGYSLQSDRLDELKPEILKTYSMEELTKSLTWLDPERELIYLAIGLCKGREILGQLRDDLDNKFDRIKDAYKAVLNELKIQCEKTNDQTNLKIVLTLIDDFNKDTVYGENKFTKSALKILIEYGEKEDIRFAKQFMISEESAVKVLATKLFVNLAGKDDISLLVDIAMNNAGDISNKASQKALSLCDDSSVLETFLKSNNRELIKLCLKEKLNKGQFLEKEKVEKLILNTNEDIRVITVAYLMKALGQRRAKLEQILDKYLENQTYYYNVVCWLDRILYAPRNFRELYRKQLSAKLDG